MDGLGSVAAPPELLSVSLPLAPGALAATPLNFYLCVGTKITKTPEPLVAA